MASADRLTPRTTLCKTLETKAQDRRFNAPEGSDQAPLGEGAVFQDPLGGKNGKV
jgi:hypothetical protein